MATQTRPAPTSLKILMFPWLAYGHIFPYLEVAKKLSERGFYIYLCSTPINLESIKKKISPKYLSSIELVELHLPELPELPPSLHTTNGLPPHLMPTLRSALYNAKSNMSEILVSLKPNLLIHDIQPSWTPKLALRHKIPIMSFSTVSAAFCSFNVHLAMKPGIQFPFPSIRLFDYEQARFRELCESMKNGATEENDPQDDTSGGPFYSAMLIRSSVEIEGKYLDYLSGLLNCNFISVCPLTLQEHEQPDEKDDEELMQWLEKQSERSSVFVSFGSEYFLNKQEREEMAYGLELSNVNFIWALKFPKGEKIKIEEALPEGFLERVKERGRIVEGWAPQAKILSHSSTGGFVSHCGWNSVLESIESGVPIIAMPMNIDQPMNARLVVEIGVGIDVMRDENGNMKRENIAEVIRDVVMEKTGEDLRKNANDLREKLKAREKEDFDGLAGLLKQICDSS